MIKRVKAHAKRWWNERERGNGNGWKITGIVVMVTVGGIALVSSIGLFLPAAMVMGSAAFLHGVWDQVPALSYVQSLSGMLGLWLVGWTVGMLLRFFIFALFGGAR
jgi:hypothetical protein